MPRQVGSQLPPGVTSCLASLIFQLLHVMTSFWPPGALSLQVRSSALWLASHKTSCRRSATRGPPLLARGSLWRPYFPYSIFPFLLSIMNHIFHLERRAQLGSSSRPLLSLFHYSMVVAKGAEGACFLIEQQSKRVASDWPTAFRSAIIRKLLISRSHLRRLFPRILQASLLSLALSFHLRPLLLFLFLFLIPTSSKSKMASDLKRIGSTLALLGGRRANGGLLPPLSFGVLLSKRLFFPLFFLPSPSIPSFSSCPHSATLHVQCAVRGRG